MLADAEEDILAFYAFPAAHWSKLRSTDPLERFKKEVGRRTDVVGIFPDDRPPIRLVGMLCVEQNDEWLVGRRYPSAAAMAPLLEQRLHRDNTPNHEGGPRAHRSLSSYHLTDEHGRHFLHHVPGLDFSGRRDALCRVWQPRDVALVRDVRRYKFLTAPQLRNLWWPESSVQAADRRLLKLFGAGYLERFRPISRRGSFPPREARARQGVLRVGDYWSAEFLRDPRPASCDPTRSSRWRDPTAPAPASCSSSTTERGASTRSTRSSGATTPSYLDTTAVASSSARSTAARSSSRMSGTFCGGWPTRLGGETGFSRIRYVTAAR
jgi:Transposase, Mutator family